MMITYLTIGTNDLARASAFFEQLFTEMPARKAYQTETLVAWQFDEGGPLLVVNQPYDGNTATIGNGSMIALAVDAPLKVDELHARALSLGASDEGVPGYRGKQFYGAYFRDLDGNKFNVHVMLS